jgi:hypothetical protein
MLMPSPPLRDHDFIPTFPTYWLALVCEANAYPALPLLLAIRRRFTMKAKRRRKVVTVTLDADIWKAAGYPDKHARERALKHLRNLSSIVTLETSSALAARYCVRKGLRWDKDERSVDTTDNEPADL